MTKRMLIDATHAEETRVVVLDGSRLEDFDVETSTKKQLKGNIYLAKVVRVEPSLQAAFVEYGGGRHGFLAFGEIHPDYYQIPVADRQRLLEMAAEEAREEEEAEDRRDNDRDAGREPGWAVRADPPAAPDDQPAAHTEMLAREELAAGAASEGETEPTPIAEADGSEHPADTPIAAAASATPPDPAHHEPAHHEPVSHEPAHHDPEPHDEPPHDGPRAGPAQPALIPSETRYGDADAPAPDLSTGDTPSLFPDLSAVVQAGDADGMADYEGSSDETPNDDSTIEITQDDTPPPETIGGDSDAFEGNGAEEASRRRSSRVLRSYRIQEVIRRRQILLIQVVKEERGTKGAALTTYISLAGRYCVLMPNSPRGGGISRKITSAADRKRLKEITAELEIPKGMGLIVRTAGANRPKPEIRRDCEYLMSLWDHIRDVTLRSMAPALIYEEASLIKRSIRDVYSRDVDEIIVDGEDGWRQAHDFMRMLMPSHAKKVHLWQPQGQHATGGVAMPLFAKHQVDLQLDAMLAPTVQLRSGGYLVINQTEALVAIDVNSGRSTRERGIEETALKTNLEAADEVARQLRLRDLAGLIVIDFIDMDARKHNSMVERRLKDALRNDRARIQLGAISHFGLLEMSRQRLRPSLAETSFVTCPHCSGLGHVRSVESSAIHVLRAVEEEGAKLRAAAILVYVAGPVVMYILNNKRERLAEIEARYAMRVAFAGDDTLVAPAVRIDRLRPQVPEAERLLSAPPAAAIAPPMEEYDDEEEPDVVQDDLPAPARASTRAEIAPIAVAETDSAEARAAAEESEQRRRRRRRRRGGRRDGTPSDETRVAGDDQDNEEGPEDGSTDEASSLSAEADAAPTETTLEAELETSEAGGEIPVGEQLELDETGEPKARRRGRRGGRRRRRGEPATEAGGDDIAEPEMESIAAPDSYVAPAYTGPTPADPFNNTYDIFDMLEQAEQAASRPHSVLLTEPAPESTTIAASPVPGPQTEPVPEPVAESAHEPAPEPAVEPPVVAASPVLEEPEPTPPPAEPLIKPILIGGEGTDELPRKRGWWRR